MSVSLWIPETETGLSSSQLDRMRFVKRAGRGILSFALPLHFVVLSRSASLGGVPRLVNSQDKAPGQTMPAGTREAVNWFEELRRLVPTN